MSISYPVNVPTSIGDVANVKVFAINVIGEAESEFTMQGQLTAHQGDRWKVVVDLNPMPRESAEEWLAFLLSLRGKYGTFLMGDPRGQAPRGTATGSPRVRTSSQAGYSVEVYGFTSSTTSIMKAGDYVMFGPLGSARMHKVLQDVNTTSGGRATLEVWPRLNTPPTSGTAVVTRSCAAIFQLEENSVSWEELPPDAYMVAFSAKERI